MDALRRPFTARWLQTTSRLLVIAACTGVLVGGKCAHTESALNPEEQAAAPAQELPPVYRGAPLEPPENRTVAERTRDQGITNLIRARLLADEQVSATRVVVRTFQGEVSLVGVVTSSGAHRRALRIAQSTPGVTAVHDGLTIIQR